MKPLSVDDVRKAIYELMAKNGHTTTLDVKNLLRDWNFMAVQKDVSDKVNIVAREDSLSNRNNGQFNTYYFGNDTNDTLQAYLERGDNFVEVNLKGKKATIIQGKIGTDGNEEERNYYKNIIALKEVKQLVNFFKTVEGFQEAVDKRPPLEIRQKYGHLFGLQPVSCKIGYFNVIKHEETSSWQFTKSAGYKFVWNTSFSKNTISKVLSRSLWTTVEVQPDKMELIGEKIKDKKEVTNGNNQTLLEVNNKNMFEVELVFENGQWAVFSKFNLDVDKQLIPLLNQFLQ